MRDNHDSINQNTLNESVRFSEKLSREAFVLAAGTIGGAITEAAKHPAKTIAETAEISLATAGLTALAVAELPVISTVALGTGAFFTGKYVFELIDPNSVHNRERNQAFRSAIDTASCSTDPRALNLAIEDLQRKTGIDSLQVIEGLFAGGAVKFGLHVPAAIEKLPVVERVPRGLQLNFATTAIESRMIPTWKNLSHNSTPTFEDFVNFKAVPRTLRTRSLASYEAALQASGKTPTTKPQETAAYRTASKKNQEAGEKETETLPPPQGEDHRDHKIGSLFFNKYASYIKHTDKQP